MGRFGALLLVVAALGMVVAFMVTPLPPLVAAAWRAFVGTRRRVGDTLRRSARGFTMIEALIVAAIIGILAAILIPLYQHAQCRSHPDRDGCAPVVAQSEPSRKRTREFIECREGYDADVNRDNATVRITCK